MADIEAQEKLEREQKENARKAKIALKNYYREQEELKQRSYTSFGKLILADEFSEPIWSLGKANRFAATGADIKIPKDTPGPIYTPADEEYYKYKYSPKWKIGNGLRPNLYAGERFAYFDYSYSEKDDLGKIPKRWDKKVGGAMPLEPRIKYDFKEGTPGPGRYEPSLKLTRPKPYTYFIGERLKNFALNNITGTDDKVGPGKYDVQKSKLTSIHTNLPTWTMGQDKRKGLFNKTWTVNQTYEIYSSIGKQIRTHKRSEAEINIGKATRDHEKLRGIFPQQMERRPQPIRIPLPNF